MSFIYFDHAATTPMHPQVLESMLPFFREHFGNPSSIHSFGREARVALDTARDSVARHLGCLPSEILFTSGGTESDNTALFGVAAAAASGLRHIITAQVEHHAVLHACQQLEKRGFDVTYLPVDASGRVHIEDVEAAIRPDTLLITVMYGNNEVGTLQPIQAIGDLAKSRGVLFHVDAVQALGTERLNLGELPVDLLSLSAHKINGPKGTGALYIAKGTPVEAYLFGGSQEKKRRGGTENVAGIVGFAKAVQLAVESAEEKQQTMRMLRQYMVDSLSKHLGEDGFVVNGHPELVLPHVLNISFPDVDTESMLMSLDMEGIACSSGSACTSGSLEVSHVLRAMNLTSNILRSAVRFSFGMGNTIKEIDQAAKKIETIAARIRSKA